MHLEITIPFSNISKLLFISDYQDFSSFLWAYIEQRCPGHSRLDCFFCDSSQSFYTCHIGTWRRSLDHTIERLPDLSRTQAKKTDIKLGK